MENGMGTWTRTTQPAVGDYFALENNVVTEDFCTDNRTNIWVDWDNVTRSLVPHIDNRLLTPPVDIDRSGECLLAFDVYRNLPLDACFYYSVNYRTRMIGANWTAWMDPTGLLYYGSSKDWIRQKVELPLAAGKDSVQCMFIVKDYGQIYCGGPVTASNVYPLFDNVAIGIKQVAPPIFVQRDLDLFNDTFRTTPFFGNDNFNTPLGDSAVVQVTTSRGYKNGFMYYRFNNLSLRRRSAHRIRRRDESPVLLRRHRQRRLGRVSAEERTVDPDILLGLDPPAEDGHQSGSGLHRQPRADSLRQQ
jgi:hypothetical protein